MTDPCRLYLITPPVFEPSAFADTLASALDAGDVSCVQLRLKDVAADDIRRRAEALMPVCHARDVAFLINDYPDIAAELGADGVHIGADDTSYDDARQIVGPDAIVGVSCYDSRHDAMAAAEAGADYIAFGAFFPTTTKIARATPAPDILAWWSEYMVVPSVAIGGITPENCGPLVAAGADFLAVINAVWQHESGPGEAVRAFNGAIASHQPN